MTDDLILHHFESSPFSEKVRVAFGMKSASWRSVLIPTIMPKPDYVPLTGGYRRTPSLQIGADVYCDTQVILAELERRLPSPSLIPRGLEGLVWPLNWWADRLFFHTTVPIIFGALGEQVPQAFIKDRETLLGRPFDTKAMREASGPLKGQWRAQAAWLDTQLTASPSGWLLGDGPSFADAAAYMNFWFLGQNLGSALEALTTGLGGLASWTARIRALGHGRPLPMTGEEALATARGATPAVPPAHDASDPLNVAPGDKIAIGADDYGRDRVEGTLVAATPDRVILQRTDPIAGAVHVHFPRAGYTVVRA